MKVMSRERLQLELQLAKLLKVYRQGHTCRHVANHSVQYIGTTYVWMGLHLYVCIVMYVRMDVYVVMYVCMDVYVVMYVWMCM